MSSDAYPASKQQVRKVDAVIVGGGPCGLALALGLLRQHAFSVVVVEQESAQQATTTAQDWSKAYSYRVDVRGMSLLKRIGLFEKLVNVGVKSEGFRRTDWLPDGTLKQLPPRTLGSTGYWIQRPRLLQLLEEEIPADCKINGTVSSIEFDDEENAATVTVALLGNNNGDKTGVLRIQTSFVFGCDGLHSVVRSSLETIDPSFAIKKIDCPSAGIMFRATLMQPSQDFDPHQGYLIRGKTGRTFSLLPFAGEPNEPRPMACARHPDYPFFQVKTPEELYNLMDAEFPQLQLKQDGGGARNRISPQAALAWCQSEGSIFPKPRWAQKAATVLTNNNDDDDEKTVVIVVLLGDALHSIPPDLGQGVNSGMVDVGVVLDMMEELQQQRGLKDGASSVVEAVNAQLTQEAEALCRLLPVGMPYQYTLPLSLHKIAFYSGFMTRLSLFYLSEWMTRKSCGIIPRWFYAPAILEIQDDPPKQYSTILGHHCRNTLFLRGIGILLVATGVGVWKSRSRSRSV